MGCLPYVWPSSKSVTCFNSFNPPCIVGAIWPYSWMNASYLWPVNFRHGSRWKKQGRKSNRSSCNGIWLFWPCHGNWCCRGLVPMSVTASCWSLFFLPKLFECWNCFLSFWVLQAPSTGREPGSRCFMSSCGLTDWLILCGWMSRCFQSSCCQEKIPSAKYYYELSRLLIQLQALCLLRRKR